MEVKVLIVAIVENNEGEILLRKKPDGSPPYEQTWYIFGAELKAGEPIADTLKVHIRRQVGVDTSIVKELGWDTEVKADLDDVTKQFVYLDVLCKYESGELTITDGIERLEWVAKERLAEYDNVPPSVELFNKLGYL
jgi:ADP-ribose pyrophosphatase YjhB (NUDIX family)